jgi:hypothetical protein
VVQSYRRSAHPLNLAKLTVAISADGNGVAARDDASVSPTTGHETTSVGFLNMHHLM